MAPPRTLVRLRQLQLRLLSAEVPPGTAQQLMHPLLKSVKQ